ncbi:MAG: M20/M25/M40 family metallo-hydrolase [Candidatus Omnitrophota bacterium]
MKDIVLEILKDIDSLANLPYRKSDFVWWLTMCINFEPQVWGAGTKQVLAGYQELKTYIIKRRELSARFTTNPEEEKRLTAAWDSLDKIANFSKPATISLLNNTLNKISEFVTNPREFVFWIGTMSELNQEALEAFCRDITTTFDYYKSKGKTRDFNHLPAVLNQYYKIYHQTVLITPELLDILTDSQLEVDKRIEKIYQYLATQKIVKLGAPPNLVGLVDSVSFDELFRAVEDEDTIRNIIQYYEPVKRAASKMGRDGVYSYFESQKPAFYRHFLEEAKGLKPGFNQPGEKFRVSYKNHSVAFTKEEESQLTPIPDNVQALRQLIQYLRMEWPNLYDNFIEPKRELIKGRPLEEFVTSDTVSKMAQQLLSKVQGWQFSEQQRNVFIIKIIEVLSFQGTADLRARINNATDDFSRLRLVVQYWERVLKLALEHKWLQENSKYFKEPAKVVKQRLSSINNKLGDGGEGILQFYLSGGTLADFFKGWVSNDCTKNTDGDHAHFPDTQAFVMDPACFLFKVIERNKWVANIYTFAFKDKNGKFYLYIDMFQLNLQHEITKSNQDKEEWRVEFCSRFLKELIGYLGSLGFDYLVVSTNPAQHRIGPDILTAVKRQYGKQSPETISLRKMGGTEFFSEAGVGEEFLWTLNGNLISNDFQDVTGYKIEIDKTTPQVLQLKQSELDHLEKLLGEMSSEETRLASLAKERREELSHLNRKGQEAANTGKNALASQFKNASDQKTTEVQKIEYELNELRIRVREKKDELEHLAVELGLRRGSSPLLGGRLASIIPVTLLSGFLFANKAQAQDFSSGDWFYNPLTPLVFVAGVAGFVGLVCYILYKLFPQKPERDTYYEREYFPRPAFQEYRLPDDLKTQLSQVLDKLSPEARGLLPNSIDVRIPFEVGISRAQAVKALGLLYSNLIKHGSILDFFKDKDFYRSFKQKAKELELADDFDQPKGKSYFFTVPKEKIRYEEDRRAEEFITQYLTKIRKKQVSNTEETLERIHQERSRLLRKEMYRGATQTDLYAYYQLLLSYATLESKAKLDEVDDLLSEKNYLGALSVLEEFFRIDIGGELISLEENVRLKDALNKVLQTELEDIRWQFNRSAAFQTNKQQIIRETNDIQFELRLSERTADDVLRGVASGDCTSINGSAFYNTIPQFMFDPGLLVFKVIQDDKWVGNVYTIVAEKDGNPVLIMDAVQLPVWGRSWPVSVKELSDKVLEKVVEYANSQGFAQVLMSSFVSNFNAIHDHFDQKYPATAQEIEKASGFEHLKALGLWDNYAARNEYLETFSPHWNYSLKRVDPNNPKQTLLLRTIWQRNAPEEPQEIQPSDSGETAVLDRAKEEQKPASAQDNLASSPSQTNPQSVKKNTPKQGHAFRNFCTGILLAAALLLSSGCATAFNSRIGPIAIHSRTEVTLSEPKPHEAPLSISGSVELGEKTKKKEASKTAEVKKYSQGAELLTSGSARLGPLTGDINPKVGVSEVPEGEAPISIGAKASIGEKVKQNKADTEGVELATEAKVRLGPLTAQADPKVGLSDVPEGQKPVDLKGDIKVQEVKEEPVLQQDVQPESQAPDTAQIIAQINEQIKSIQAELEKLRQADSDLKIEVSDLMAKLIDAQKQIEQLKTSPKAPEEVTQLEEKKSDYERQIANLELQQKQAQKELDRILAEKAKAGQEVRQLQNQAPHMQQKVESLHTEINQLETQKKQGAESVTQLQSQKTGLETNVNQLTQDKSKLEQELTGLRQQIGQAKAVLEEAKVKSEPTFKNIWFSLPWQEKLGIILLSLTGIGILVGGVILWKRWSRFKNLSDRVKELQQKADDLERQLSTQRKEKEDLTKEIEQQKTKTLDLEAERNRQADELKRITEQLAALKEEHERIQAELIQVKEAKDKTTEELQAKIAELKSQIAQKESEIVSLSFKEEIAPSVPAPQEISQKLSDAEIDRAVELLRALPSREMQRLLRSQKIDVRERIRFLHDELGLDIANGHGRSLLFRNPDTLRNQKVFLESLGLPLTVTNLASSKRGFAKKELNQIIKQTAWNEEWQVLTNEEKLSVVSHLYDIYGLRVSWLLRDNDWYQLLHAFGLPGEPINYTPRSIDFIQRYELSRFQKFHNTAQTKYRLSKIKEVIKILDLKVINLLDVKTTPEGFEIFVVKPEVREGKVDYQKEHYPLPDTDFIPPESAGEQPEDIAALEPQETILTPQLEEKASHLKEEIASLEKTIAGLEEEKKQKTAQLEKQIQDLTQQKEKLVQEITQLENDLQAKQQAMSLSITQEEDRINKLQEEKLGYEQAVQDLKQKIDAYQQELKALEQQKDKARQELEALQDTSAARAQIETLNKEQQQIEENLRKIKAELVDLTARKKQLEENISAYQGTRDKLQEETAVLNKKIEELNQSIHSLEAEKDALAKQENERAAQIKATQLNQEIEGLTRQKEELSRQNATLENEIKTKQNELALSIREAETQANKIKEEIAGLTQELAVLREEREKLRTETAGLKGYQQDVESKKQELLSLDKEKQALQEEIRSLEAQKTALKEGFDKAQQELEAVKQRLEEQKTSQAQLSQQALTAEQQKLQEQLDTQRQSIQAQMNALEQEFNKQRQEHLATLLKLEEEKNKSKHELDDLLAQKDKAINEMNKLNVALEDLKKTEASYKKAIGYWKFQIELLKEDIVELKEEKEQLAREVETLKKAKEAAPEIEELIEEVRIVSEEVDALLGIIGPQDNTSIYSAVIDKVKATLGNLNYEIKEEPLSGDSRRKNIIVKIPASIGMEHLPKIILNAHMDAYYEHGYTVNSLKGNRRSGGALDDRAGVVAILSALNLIKERFVRQNLAHGPIVLIFTDMEEKGAVGAKDLVSKYNSGSRGATESLFDNTRIAIVLDGPILWMTDVDIRSLNNVEMKNPFVIAKLLNIGKNDKEYRIVNDSVGLVNFRDFSRPRYADKDGEGDHRAFADAYDKKLKRKVPVINIRSPYNDIDENGTIQYHSPNEKVDIENELVPVAQWVAEIVFRLVKDMTPKTRQTSAIITTQKNNELPLPIWEYTVEWDKDYYPVLSPASYQVGPLSSEALKDLTDVLKKLTDVYPVRGEDKIRTIKIVAGNDRLATINREKGEIVLDINVFASKELLLMEVEHELLHLHLPSGQIKQDVKNAVIEEFIILLFEISRFLKFDNEQQLRVLVILKDDPHLDDKEFYRILSKAKSDGLVSVLDDVTRYMKQEGVYPPEFVEYLKDKNGRDIFKDMDRDLHMCKFCLANIFLDRKVIGEIGINIMPIIFNIIYGYAEMNTDIYTNPLFNPDTSKMLVETFGTESLLADLVKITPRLLDFDKEFTGEYTNASGLPKAMIFDLDRTLSRTLRVVPTEILEQIKGFLKARVKVAIITAQSLEEVKTYFIEPLYKLLKDSGEPEGLLSNLYVGTSEGSQLWQFFTQGQFKEVILDDATEAPFDTAEHKKELHKIVRDAIREVIRPKGDIPIVGPILIQAPGITFIHNRDYSLSLGIREKISPDQRSELIKAIKRKIPANWQIDILVSGGGTIHIVSKGVDKSTAVGMFRNYLSPDIKPQQILIIGDDFGPGGLDRKMIIPGAKIYSVGAKHNIPPEVEFYGDGGEHGWQRSMHLFVNRIKSDFAGAAKGRGMFSPDEHIDVNEVIMAAQREHRGSLIWGDASGWQDNRAKYAQDIAWVISSLKRYPEIKITGLGKIDIPEVLSTSNIVLIVPHNNSPPGLLVNSENAYQIAHNGLSRNSIYIDEVSYSQLYTFEVAVLLAHEAILLGAKKLAARKGIPWTEQLARDVSQLAEDYEIKIVGRSEKGKGSRFDERIEEILELNKPKPKQARPIEEPPAYEPEEKPQPTIPPQPEPKLQKKPQPTNNNFSLDFPDTKDSVIDGLRKLFFDSMFRDTTNLPVPIGDFPPPMAREIKQSYDLNKVKGLPLDPDFLVALTVFFSRIFPNHANDLINYLRSLNIYIIDNGNSTFGATLSRNTFYIQRSCLEDLLGRPVSVEEIKQGIKNRDKQILVALFRIIVHEIGSAFFKLSHPADQDLERLFLALLSKTTVPLPPGTEQEFRTINSSVNLDSLPRIDWASKKLKPTDLMREEIRLTRDDMTGLVKEINSKLINSLYSPNQQVRNNAAISLVKFGATEALPFLRLFLEKEPDNKIVSDAIAALEVRLNNENAEILKIKTADPFAPALFSVDENNDLVLGNSAIQAINMLCIGYDGMTLEIDVDTLIDTSKGAPQLKGLGFREALASLYQAQEKKQIPENIHVRLINIDPALNRDKIVKVLGLTDDLLKSLVTIPDIPQDYIIKSLEPYLIAGSIRIIFEDNVRYWGKKVDVLVKRGEETKTLSSLGLIVASLAKEPKFYEQLPKELKEYIVAKTDETGKVQLDDEGKIKELIFKPIEKSKVDTQYLDKLDKANKELEGMV